MLTIKEIRENKRLSQTDFAKIMNVSLRTIQNWEKDRAMQRLKTISNKFA